MAKCMQSMYFAKPPGKPGQAWHQDEIYIQRAIAVYAVHGLPLTMPPLIMDVCG